MKPPLKGRGHDSVLPGQGCDRRVWSNGPMMISRGNPKELGQKRATVLLFHHKSREVN